MSTTLHTARRYTVNVALAALTVSPWLTLAAQAKPIRSDTLSARARDSLIAAVLAETLDSGVEPLDLRPSYRQSVTVRPIMRRYSVGEIDATEQAAYASWMSRYDRATLRVDFTPLSYRGDTSVTAERPPVGVGGASPISGRLDLRVRSADTLRLFAQSSSFPGALSAEQSQALAAVGTSTIDLDAAALGVAARLGGRYALTQAIGRTGVSLTLRGGVEYDPRPSGEDAVSWRGTTVRGGLGVTHAADNTTVGASVEMTRSYTDSLEGRNLFPGGGLLNVEARLLRFFGRDGTGLLTLNGFYSRSVDIERPAVATRIIPIGDFMGGTASLAIPAGSLTVLPTLSVLRESSQAAARVNRVPTRIEASGTTASASLGLLVPVGRHLTLTPEIGGAFGNVGQTTSARFPLRTRQQSFNDTIRGRWASLEITVSR